TVRKLKTIFGRNEAPSAPGVRKFLRKVRETDMLMDTRSHPRARPMRSVERIVAVAQSVRENPRISTRYREQLNNAIRKLAAEVTILTADSAQKSFEGISQATRKDDLRRHLHEHDDHENSLSQPSKATRLAECYQHHKERDGEDDAASVLAPHSVREAPRLSLRRRAIETEISKSHLQRIFKQNRILPFKPKFRHTLEEGDEAKRLDFCLEMGNRVLNDVIFHKRILFSDESTFSTNGVVSSQHCRYWCETNPHFTISCRRQYLKKVNMWCTVSYTNGIIGPYFFKENLNRNTYLEMLQNCLTDTLDELPLSYRTRMFFQQDGCPARHAVTVRNWLNSEFNEH
ncbi:hypothetical protein NQ318_014244, partial [Aromia moschata]